MWLILLFCFYVQSQWTDVEIERGLTWKHQQYTSLFGGPQHVNVFVFSPELATSLVVRPIRNGIPVTSSDPPAPHYINLTTLKQSGPSGPFEEALWQAKTESLQYTDLSCTRTSDLARMTRAIAMVNGMSFIQSAIHIVFDLIGGFFDTAPAQNCRSLGLLRLDGACYDQNAVTRSSVGLSGSSSWFTTVPPNNCWSDVFSALGKCCPFLQHSLCFLNALCFSMCFQLLPLCSCLP